MGFVFYDIETTGLSPFFDQIVQFAAIRTDDQLNPIERIEVKSRLMPHILPSPEALCVTGTDIEELLSPARPSFFEMMCGIHKTLLRWSPSTFIGYNSIRFDEAFLRHALYQTLHPAYLTSNHGNARGDALRLARAVHALRPDALCAAAGTGGTTGFRLQDICTANGFRTEISHEAMADAEAMLWLCRLVADRAPDIWSQFLRFTNKASVREFLQGEEAVILIDPRGNDPGLRVLTSLGSSIKDPNLQFCVDLTADIASLRQLEPDAVAAAVSALGGPIHRVRINASPLMLPIYEAEGLDGVPSEAACLQQAAELKSDSAFAARLLSAARRTEPVYPPSPHVESQLYERFATDEDERLMAEFHSAEWDARLMIVRQFQDVRFVRLGRRIVFFERPGLLDDNARAMMAAAIKQRHLPDGEINVPWTTIAAARSRTEAMLAAGPAHSALLLRYNSYLGEL